MLLIFAEIGANYRKSCSDVLDHVEDEHVRDDCSHTDRYEDLLAPGDSYLILDVPMK